MKTKVFEHLMHKRPGFLPVLDPDRWDDFSKLDYLIKEFNEGASGILIGTSLFSRGDYFRFVKYVKERAKIPVIIFPNGPESISEDGDALLFLVLLSGRNPEYLISQQVKAAFSIKKSLIEVIPVGYLLVDGGKITSVQFMSNTLPIPRDKIDILLAHAFVAEFMGMKTIFLEAGSGAEYPVPIEMIKVVKKETNLLTIVGGGLKKLADIEKRIESGADFVVIGNILESDSEKIKYITKIFKNNFFNTT